MIKILKRGTRKTIECEDCGCLFTYDEEDVDYYPLNFRHVICPQCKSEIDVGGEVLIKNESNTSNK
jgi:Zn finger protein HypA/HybF involved in hydrogenase expression